MAECRPCNNLDVINDWGDIVCKINDIILSIDAQGEVFPVKQYYDDTDIVKALCLLLLVIDGIEPEDPTDLAIYVVDGNNTVEGTGAVTNPYQTIDRAISRVLGTDGQAAPTRRVTVVVRGYEGVNYEVNENMWLNCNWVFEQGAIVTNGAGLSSTHLFNQDLVTLKSIVPNIYGLGNFDLTVGFFQSSDTSTLSLSDFAYYAVSFASIISTVEGIRLRPTAYTGGGQAANRYTISGGNGSVKGTLRIENNAGSAFIAEASGAFRAMFTISGVAFVDQNTGGGSVPFIELNSPTFGTTVTDISVSLRSASTRSSLFRITGDCSSLVMDNLTVNKGSHSSPVTIFDMRATAGTFDNRLTNAVIELTDGPTAGSKLFKKTSTSFNNLFTVNNIVSNVSFDGDIDSYIDASNSGTLIIEEKTIISNSNLTGLSYVVPTQNEQFAQKKYVDDNRGNSLYTDNGTLSGTRTISGANNTLVIGSSSSKLSGLFSYTTGGDVNIRHDNGGSAYRGMHIKNFNRSVWLHNGANGTLGSNSALEVTENEGIKVYDTVQGLGLNYKDNTVDEANVGAWGAEDNHIPSEARVNKYTQIKTITFAKTGELTSATNLDDSLCAANGVFYIKNSIKITKIEVSVDEFETSSTTEGFSLDIYEFDANGTATTSWRTGMGTTLHTYSEVIPINTSGSSQFMYTASEETVDIDIDGSTTPKAIKIRSSALTAAKAAGVTFTITYENN